MGLGLSCLCASLVPRFAGETGRSVESRPAPQLDCHVHISSPGMTDRLRAVVGQAPPGRGADELVARLDREGIRQAWVLSEGYLAASAVWDVTPAAEEPAAVRAENTFVSKEAARFPDRLVPFLSVNPRRPWAADEIDHSVESLGMRGLKLHCWNSLVDVRDAEQLAAVRAVLRRAAFHRVPVVAHVFNGSVRGFGAQDIRIWARELVAPLKELRVCFAHLGGAGGFDPPVQRTLAALVEELGPGSAAADRVRLDLSAVLMGPNELGFPPTPEAHRQRMAELLAAWGTDRLLWGSDSLPDYLRQTQDVWPLGRDAWRRVCEQTGASWVGDRLTTG